MQRIKADRRQHRHQFTKEEIPDPFTLAVVPDIAPQKTNSLFHQGRKNNIVKQLVLTGDQRVHLSGYLLKCLTRRHAIRTKPRRIQFDLFFQPGDTHFKEFIKIAADNADKTQAFQQRGFFVLCLSQHPAIKFDQAQFPIQKLPGKRHIRSGDWCLVRFVTHHHSSPSGIFKAGQTVPGIVR